MKLELKNIKHSAFASHETACFQADLYVDGKPFLIVENDGNGGCDLHHKHPKNPMSHDEYRDELRNLESFFEGQLAEGISLDSEVNRLLNDHLYTKKVKSLMSRSMIVLEKDDHKNGYYKYGKKKYDLSGDFIHSSFRNLLAKHFPKGYVLLNDMPLKEAVSYFRCHA